jgi:hypothetical protein
MNFILPPSLDLRPSGYEPHIPAKRFFFDFNGLRDNPLICNLISAALGRKKPQPTGQNGEQSS